MDRNINLLLPVRDVYVTQPYGVNYLDFYKVNFGLKGHPGVDFRARDGCKITAAHDGIISWCGNGKDNGIGIEIWDKDNRFKTFYYHHLSNISKIQKGIEVTAGEIIALADNTGKYTTGDHEHFELYFVDDNGNTLDKDNGFGGSVNPSPYFEARYGKNWDKSAVYNYYGKKRDLMAEIVMRFKNAWLHRRLKSMGYNPVPGDILTNVLVYGHWDFETAINPAMADIWQNLTKEQYNNGWRSFE